MSDRAPPVPVLVPVPPRPSASKPDDRDADRGARADFHRALETAGRRTASASRALETERRAEGARAPGRPALGEGVGRVPIGAREAASGREAPFGRGAAASPAPPDVGRERLGRPGADGAAPFAGRVGATRTAPTDVDPARSRAPDAAGSPGDGSAARRHEARSPSAGAGAVSRERGDAPGGGTDGRPGVDRREAGEPTHDGAGRSLPAHGPERGGGTAGRGAPRAEDVRGDATGGARPVPSDEGARTAARRRGATGDDGGEPRDGGDGAGAALAAFETQAAGPSPAGPAATGTGSADAAERVVDAERLALLLDRAAEGGGTRWRFAVLHGSPAVAGLELERRPDGAWCVRLQPAPGRRAALTDRLEGLRDALERGGHRVEALTVDVEGAGAAHR